MATTYKDQARPLMSNIFIKNGRSYLIIKMFDHHAIIPTEVRPVMSDLSNNRN